MGMINIQAILSLLLPGAALRNSPRQLTKNTSQPLAIMTGECFSSVHPEIKINF
jgi:hypothetical protein